MKRYQLASSLLHRIEDFLPTVRVGIDFGEHAGGIAVVKNNGILHAETYLDFHEATLEDRRRLRRGRRTRHAKKMRLARFRSWVLRQRLPDGTQFPDPYEILRDKRLWVQPGIYQTEGKDPRAAISWIDLAKQGQVDSTGFIRALTLIFKKRGYRFDNRALSEMSDKDLGDFLKTARIPPEATSLIQDIETQIARREAVPDDPVRGRKKLPIVELRDLFLQACNRKPQPRMAEHRSVKEAEIGAIIDGFGRATALPAETLTQWKRELVGAKDGNNGYQHHGLLNKVLRPARFDNRLRSGCSWCGKKTPRKYKVREMAYRAAVNNLRARAGWRERPITEDEKNQFLNWWNDRQNAPGLATIKKHLTRLNPQQVRMANQLHDLLKNQQPKGRASLCKQHLQMAANGKTMKDAGVDWQSARIRNAANPQREQHDKRVLHRLEQILFVKGKYGDDAWRYGPVALISLEVPEPQTERLKPGQVPERQQETFKQRLLKELSEKCVYCDGPAVDKDHIFPRSKGGPDIWDNLVAACKSCNDQKGDRTPFQWLGSDAARWTDFSSRVNDLPLGNRKRQIFLNETEEFPGGDPTPFARVGSRPKQFVFDLRRLFESYGVAPPELHYQTGRCHVQLTRGRLTAKLRESWLLGPNGSQNFPKKDPLDLHNHAQDAALVACCPPHTWRDRIFLAEAERPGRDGRLITKPGLAVPELAPNWAEFIKPRNHPIVRILGRYPVTWKSSFADETFGRNPDDTQSSKLIISKLVKDLKVTDLKNIVSSLWREQLTSLAEQVGLAPKQVLPREMLAQKFPNLRRLQLFRQPGGIRIKIKPADGPPRKLQIKVPSEGIVVWKREKKIGLSIIRPRPLQRLGLPRIDPPPGPDAIELGRLHRHQMITLSKNSKHAAGFYRLTKFQDSGVEAILENAMPAEIAMRLRLKRAKSRADEESTTNTGTIVLGKRELATYFLEKQAENMESRKRP
jgi:hypothetical protein